MSVYKNIIFSSLMCLFIIANQANIAFAEKKHVDLFTIYNEEGKYRYYSSPEDSAYINPLPENYVHINTTLSTTVDPLNFNIGDRVELKTTEPLQLSDFLTLPQGSTISGQVWKLLTPRKLIHNSEIKIQFDKVITPNGYEFELGKKTFEVMPLVARKGSRYTFAQETCYSMAIAGGKYPIGRFLNVPVSYAISGGAGLLGGIGYGMLTGDIKMNMGLGFLRGIGGKGVLNVLFLSGKNFILEAGTPFMLTVYKGKVEDLRYKPEYLNIQQLMIASSLSPSEKVNNELISKSAVNDSNAAQISTFYEQSVKNDSNNIDNKINLGRSYIASGSNQKAVQYFNHLLEAGNTDARIYFHLGEAQENSGNLMEAKNNYELAIKNNINNNQVYLKLAELLNKLGEPTQAAKYFEKYYDTILALK